MPEAETKGAATVPTAARAAKGNTALPATGNPTAPTEDAAEKSAGPASEGAVGPLTPPAESDPEAVPARAGSFRYGCR